MGGTAWLWSSEVMRHSVDVLFVDEAGQMSLANALAVSVATGSLVLLGDPQQLEQPIQGAHPEGADKSALEHLLGDAQTIDPTRGLFLEHTWRLHPDICRYTSDAFYEGKLDPREGLGAQRILAGGPFGGSGLRWVPVGHAGNTGESEEEADAVAKLAREIAEGGHRWINVPDTGVPEELPLTWQDVLIVAPYNAQVGAIRQRLPEGIRDRVGTVDKFQGQQAAVAIYSMTTSSPEDAPRGMEFLYSLNRLNVATSRAKCLAIVVASPELVRVRCHTPRQMRLANALCHFIESATPVAASAPPPPPSPPPGGEPQAALDGAGMTYDVAVIGLGAMGSATAHELARRGQGVLGIEALTPGHQLGSSGGLSRIIRLAYFEHPSYVPLLRAAWTGWHELEELSGENLILETGGLYAGVRGSDVLEGAINSARTHELPHELLDADEVNSRFPAFHLDDDMQALHEPLAGLLVPGALHQGPAGARANGRRGLAF